MRVKRGRKTNSVRNHLHLGTYRCLPDKLGTPTYIHLSTPTYRTYQRGVIDGLSTLKYLHLCTSNTYQKGHPVPIDMICRTDNMQHVHMDKYTEPISNIRRRYRDQTGQVKASCMVSNQVQRDSNQFKLGPIPSFHLRHWDFNKVYGEGSFPLFILIQSVEEIRGPSMGSNCSYETSKSVQGFYQNKKKSVQGLPVALRLLRGFITQLTTLSSAKYQVHSHFTLPWSFQIYWSWVQRQSPMFIKMLRPN